MFGTIHSEEYKKESSDRMKILILEGKFTPNTNNRLTHWDVEFNGRKFRSSWEAFYHALNPTHEYETLRIPYTNDDGVERIYIVDFVCNVERMATEVKPSSIIKRQRDSGLKIEALYAWCNENGYKANVFTESDIYDNFDKVDMTLFDEKTQKKLINSKMIYENKKKNRNRKTRNRL